MNESQAQVALAAWLDEYLGGLSVLWWHTPNGGHRFKHVAKKMRKQGTKAGIADIIIDLPFKYQGKKWAGLRLELKKAAQGGKGDGVFRKEQRRHLAAERLAGFYTVVSFGYEKAKATILKLYGKTPQLPVPKPITACWGCWANLKGSQIETPRRCLGKKKARCSSRAFTYSSLEEFDAEVARRTRMFVGGKRKNKKKPKVDGPVIELPIYMRDA